MSFGISRGKELDVSGYGVLSADLPGHDEGALDVREWFGEARVGLPLQIEIGSGKGTFLVQQAGLTPGVNYLGIEWAAEFFRYAADRVRRHALANVRMLHGDATEFIRYWLPSEICEMVHVYFPDPWPKKKHQKRRSVKEENLREFWRVMQAGGEVRLVTDHEDYWAWMEEHAARCADLFERVEYGGADSAGEGEIVGTNFERKYRREGRPFHAMRLVKK